MISEYDRPSGRSGGSLDGVPKPSGLRNDADTPLRSEASMTPPPRLRRLLPIVAGIAIIGAAAAASFLATRGEEKAMASGGHNHGAGGGSTSGAGTPVSLTAEQATRIGVTYAVAELTPMSREVRTVGQVTFDERRVQAISPKIEGWVEQLHVNYTGQLVTAGQPLLTIYSPMLVQAQEELLLARRLGGEVADGTSEARQSAQDLLSSARRRLAYWDIPAGDVAAIERSGQVRRTMTLRAPVGGHVLEKNVVAGQRIMSGDALYRIADLSRVWVEGEVFEQDLPVVRVGQMVHADFQSLPNEHRMGRITYVYPTLNPETRTARVRVELPNPDLALKPGMYATIRVEGTVRRQVLTVPRSAVLVTGERSLVFVRDTSGGRLVPRDVRLGVANDTRVEVLSGLRSGETVVASATFLIDAESNLGSALGGMGDMPGMDVTAPASPPARTTGRAPAGPQASQAPSPAPPAPAADPHAGHKMPED